MTPRDPCHPPSARRTPGRADRRHRAAAGAVRPRGQHASDRRGGGVAEGTIFRAFPTKDALIDAVLEDVFDVQRTCDELAAIDLEPRPGGADGRGRRGAAGPAAAGVRPVPLDAARAASTDHQRLPGAAAGRQRTARRRDRRACSSRTPTVCGSRRPRRPTRAGRDLRAHPSDHRRQALHRAGADRRPAAGTGSDRQETDADPPAAQLPAPYRRLLAVVVAAVAGRHHGLALPAQPERGDHRQRRGQGRHRLHLAHRRHDARGQPAADRLLDRRRLLRRADRHGLRPRRARRDLRPGAGLLRPRGQPVRRPVADHPEHQRRAAGADAGADVLHDAASPRRSPWSAA